MERTVLPSSSVGSVNSSVDMNMPTVECKNEDDVIHSSSLGNNLKYDVGTYHSKVNGQTSTVEYLDLINNVYFNLRPLINFLVKLIKDHLGLNG